ncbi:hypothetical protein IZ6_07660 [Terrihabitans soli]|uniref:Phage terminase small subunit P27 family n=1 Tax=Terrihabitans soli TaxID=708113 RepID=A0A6S6QSJ6_9HYPH|nr:phage terminase small subunit P27 family [Terrihabitans soli]BCJ90031.1 hypothetical protein IZ6_07660 [Terrihabitans soli]
MARGRKPDAPGLQEAKGNPGKRQKSKAKQASKPAEPKPTPVAAGGVKPPKWLRRSPAATEVWNEFAPLLTKLNLLTPLDAFPFARYCRYVVDWLAADKAVSKEGVWFNATDTNGEKTKKRHPAFHARQELEKCLSSIEAQFGMRPDSRYKLLAEQARALGFGGLFDQPAASGDNTETPAQPDAVDEDDIGDVIGVMKGMDSPPPVGRPN